MGKLITRKGETPVYVPDYPWMSGGSKNDNLSNSTVYDDGYNVDYNDNGYATKYTNVKKTGTTRADYSKDAVLDGSNRDQSKVGDANYTTNEEYDVLKQYGDMWTEAYNKGDTKGMELAHALAEQFRSTMGYSGGADGSQFIDISSGENMTGRYTPSVGSNSNDGAANNWGYSAIDPYGVDHKYAEGIMDPEDLARLTAYGEQYNAAKAAGDAAGMKAAHDAAEDLRAKYGYYGGVDGSQYLKYPTASYPSYGGSNGSGSVKGSWSYGDAPTYTDAYSERIDALLDQILNRDKFSYDVNVDPLYAMYRDQYQREGDRAMQDTLGQASARTGGMASSYATTAAQQANQYYMQQLADKVPELYQLAYEMYLDDIDLKVQDLGLLQGVSDTHYDRFRDTMSDWRNDRDFAYGVYRDDVADEQWQTQFDYGVSRDEIADKRYDQEWDYNVSRDKIEDARYDREWAYKVQQDALQAAAKAATSSGSSSGGKSGSSGTKSGSTSTSYNNGGLSSSQVKALQKALGVSQDGYYGPATKKAAGGLSADAAYKKYVGDSGYTGKGETNRDNQSSTGTKTAAMVGMSLGLGPTSASFLSELAAYGGIVEKSDGSMVWSSGWNAGNYKNKLAQAKSYNPFGSILSIL